MAWIFKNKQKLVRKESWALKCDSSRFYLDCPDMLMHFIRLWIRKRSSQTLILTNHVLSSCVILTFLHDDHAEFPENEKFQAPCSWGCKGPVLRIAYENERIFRYEHFNIFFSSRHGLYLRPKTHAMKVVLEALVQNSYKNPEKFWADGTLNDVCISLL